MYDYTVKTPEQVDISYTVAGLGTRFLALLIDSIAQYLVIFIIIMTINSVGMGFSTNYTIWLIAIIIILIALVGGGYFIFFELLLKGKTPGKAALKIRVVRKDGRAADVSGIIIRNLIRLIDFLPAMYAVGMIAIFINKDCRRLGDIVAGTVVIAEGKKASLSSILALQTTQVNENLTDQEYAIIRDFIARRDDMTEESRNKLAAGFAKPFYERFCIPADQQGSPESFLMDLLSGEEKEEKTGLL